MKSDKTTPNVPTLRFSNKTIWEKKRIKDFCEVNPKTEELEDEFIYIDLESVSKGCLLSKNIISKTNAPSRAQRVLTNNDILFQCVRPYQMNNLLFNAENADFQYVASTGYAQIRTQENPSFVYHLLHSPNFNKEVMLRCTGSSYPAITSSDLGDIEVYICGVGEQQKIGHFLDLIDRRIAVQNKIISKYETLIKGLCDMIFPSIEGSILPLKAIVSIEKGQQINGMSLAKTGKYYYLNGGIAPSGYIDDYNTSEETISISEGGNSCGFVSYNLQKFWSGGHCYTLKIMAEQCRSKYLFFYLKYKEKDIMQLRVGSGLPNIQKKSLENFNVKLPNYKKQCFVERVFEVVTAKKEIENALLERFQSQKKFLLSKMFI